MECAPRHSDEPNTGVRRAVQKFCTLDTYKGMCGLQKVLHLDTDLLCSSLYHWQATQTSGYTGLLHSRPLPNPKIMYVIQEPKPYQWVAYHRATTVTCQAPQGVLLEHPN